MNPTSNRLPLCEQSEHAVRSERNGELNLLTEIRNGILDPSILLSSTLRKAKVLAYRLKNADFKDWVDQELNGYVGDRDAIPGYRKVSSQSYGHFTSIAWKLENAPIAPACLPEPIQEFSLTVVFSEGIRSLECLVDGQGDSIRYPWPADLLALLSGTVYEGMTCLFAWRHVSRSQIEQVLDAVRNRLLSFVLELEELQPSLGEVSSGREITIPSEKIEQLFQVHIWGGYNVLGDGRPIYQGGNMTIFDQREQKVNYQYNAAGDINFEAVRSKMDIVAELEKLRIELAKGIAAGLFDEDTATDAEYQLNKTVQQAKKPHADKKTVLDHLNRAKALIEGVTAAAGLVAALGQAAAMIQQLF